MRILMLWAIVSSITRSCYFLVWLETTSFVLRVLESFERWPRGVAWGRKFVRQSTGFCCFQVQFDKAARFVLPFTTSLAWSEHLSPGCT